MCHCEERRDEAILSGQAPIRRGAPPAFSQPVVRVAGLTDGCENLEGNRMPPTILVSANPLNSAEVMQELAPAAFNVVLARPDSPEWAQTLPQAEYLVGLGEAKMDDAFYRGARKLKLIQLLSAGYDRVDIEAARRAGVPVCNNGGANGIAVAEHAIMLMLAVARRLVWQQTTTVSGRWRGNDIASVRLYELNGRTLGIIGLGVIGKKVARLAKAFGMDVLYYDIVRLNEDQTDALGVRFRLLNELLRSSDIVTLHVSLTPTTRHLIGAPELRLMKRTAYLINTCRGPVVDEGALYEALSDGLITGAGLDVFEQEPPAANNPLFGLHNVVVTPHLAGPTWENQYTRFRNAFDNVQRVARGQKPLWIIPELREPG
jgi:phosphoglycerate dehydrogenase-like enzyme